METLRFIAIYLGMVLPIIAAAAPITLLILWLGGDLKR